MINSASAVIDARCGHFVGAIVEIRGTRHDPGGASDDSELTGFGYFGPSDKVFDGIADRLADGPSRIGAWGFEYSALESSPCWHCEIIP
jgi:hypothetical protein